MDNLKFKIIKKLLLCVWGGWIATYILIYTMTGVINRPQLNNNVKKIL